MPACDGSGWWTPRACPASTSGRAGARAACRAGDARGSAGLGEAERARSVVLVQDAFTSHYETQLVLDVLDLLRLLGFTPWLAPFRPNGKALHVHGFLGAFGRVAAANAAVLRALAETGVALVGIDPSMTLTYRAEYAEALGATALPQVLLLQEWLARAADWTDRRADAGAVPAAAALHGAHHRHGVPPRLAIGLRPASASSWTSWPPAAAAWRAPTATRPSTARPRSGSTR